MYGFSFEGHLNFFRGLSHVKDLCFGDSSKLFHNDTPAHAFPF